MKHNHAFIFTALILALALSSCSIFTDGSADSALTASGIIAGIDAKVASELGGKVADINVAEGDTVQVDDVLFRLDDQILQAQRDQAAAAVDVANASLDAANAQLQSAQTQYNLTLQSVQQQDTPARNGLWTADVESTFKLPNWYFEKDELITAAQAEVDAAQTALNAELGNLKNELAKANDKDFITAEKRLAEAQAAYRVAQLTLTQAETAKENENLKNAAQDSRDVAENELNAAQSAYNSMLSTATAKSVLEARGRVAAAQARLDNAQDQLSGLQTGDQSLQLQTASAGVKQAEAGVAQATNGVAQARSALKLLDLQLAKSAIKAPFAGLVSARNLEVGELVAPGGTVMTISQLEEVHLTIYIPEDKYGQIQIGQAVSITVDSFPGQKFSGTVEFISSEAEFTPSNVQTVEGRKATVYAIKIRVPNKDLLLKPGMPADVTF